MAVERLAPEHPSLWDFCAPNPTTHCCVQLEFLDAFGPQSTSCDVLLPNMGQEWMRDCCAADPQPWR